MIEQELEKLLASSGTGMKKNYVEDEDGYNRLILSNVEAMGPAGYRDIYALSEAADAPITEREVASTMAGFPAGQAAGFVGAPGDVAALFAGLYKAAFPDADQSRLDAFLTTAGDISSKYGSEAALDFVDGIAKAAGVPDDVRQSFMRGAEGGSLVGAGKAGEAITKGIGMAAKGAVKGAKTYAAGAPQRIADRTSGTMFGAGMDPTAPIDEAIVAGQKLLKEGKGPTAENPVAVVPPTETEPGIIAFHGSGADFDQFSLEKIGTGEGAQAYGYGLYFTDSEDIAKFYRDAISAGQTKIPYGGAEDAAQAIPENIPYLDVDGYRSYLMGDAEEVISSILTKQHFNLMPEQRIIDANLDVLEKNGVLNIKMRDGSFVTLLRTQSGDQFTATPVKEKTGKIYKVGLAPKPEDMIDYQTTFADQPQKVQDALKAIGYEVEENIDLAMRRPMPMVLDSLKGKIIGDVREGAQAPDRPDKILSEKLLEQGIPGIKYRAAGSRAANIDAADAEMNYVIFDDKAIKILEKYGIVGPVAVTAIAGAQQQEGNDNGA